MLLELLDPGLRPFGAVAATNMKSWKEKAVKEVIADRWKDRCLLAGSHLNVFEE